MCSTKQTDGRSLFALSGGRGQGLCRALLGVGLLLLGASGAGAQTWNLVWSDEFNGPSIDTSNWTFETGGGGWGNNELEYYTNGANASIQNGALVIEARRENVGGMAYTSTRMNTRGKHEFTYGRIEARIALPSGQGLWPAFWMLGSNIGTVGWPASGEIDIMEHVNTASTIFGTIHWDSGGHVSYGGSTSVPSFTGYHVYSIEWSPSAITWFVDGVQYVQANILNNINNTQAFQRPFFILLNLAVGGAFPGNPNSSTPFPSRMLVDYVRVYQQSTGGGGGGTISPTAWYQVINQNSNLCTTEAGSGTANGTQVQQSTCGSGQFSQQWQFTPTSGGYYRVSPRFAPSLAWDVTGGVGATGNSVKVQLWAYGGGTNQQWLPESMGTGIYRFRARNSNRCLDVPGASTASGLQLQQYDCNGTAAQSFRLVQQ
jgi:beta-glucanase (GH16 family)